MGSENRVGYTPKNELKKDRDIRAVVRIYTILQQQGFSDGESRSLSLLHRDVKIERQRVAAEKIRQRSVFTKWLVQNGKLSEME